MDETCPNCESENVSEIFSDEEITTFGCEDCGEEFDRPTLED